MPTFQYSARDREGNLQTGVLAAENTAELREILRNKDLFLTKYQLRKGKVVDQVIGAVPDSAASVAGSCGAPWQ